MVNTMVIDDKDNVAVAIEEIRKGEPISYVGMPEGTKGFPAVTDVTIYHKVAIKDIPDDTPVVKYGEHIGHAIGNIKKGEHVHVHNVKSVREDLG
ncbi:UxaA family hydrolase [Selenomonas sp. TAMA-11512]|uniref:UxaA family hydrolase n=1 Tax=Selenomonas sp. TAMA-11512 TaxID=3095337 RepID=UPI00308EEB12|nr:UxaA family hydrolase [Selenomonas sp. TAMA-11512]